MKNAYYSYDVAKAINVVLFIIHSFGNRIHLLLLNKLLYHADRIHLERYGYLITRDKYMLMKNGQVPVNTYFLYTQLIESNSWVMLKHNIKEYFFIKGNFIYCHQSYDGNILSNAEVSCLFETIRGYKNGGKTFQDKSPVTITPRVTTLFAEIPVLDMAKQIPVNDSMLHYIQDNLKTELFKYNFNANNPNVGDNKKLSFLSTIISGTVLKEHSSKCLYITVGISFMQYMVVRTIENSKIYIEDFIADMRKAFLMPETEYAFATGNTVIDCSRLITISYNELYDWLVNDGGMIVGQMNRLDMESIFTALQSASTIPISQKDEFPVH